MFVTEAPNKVQESAFEVYMRSKYLDEALSRDIAPKGHHKFHNQV